MLFKVKNTFRVCRMSFWKHFKCVLHVDYFIYVGGAIVCLGVPHPHIDCICVPPKGVFISEIALCTRICTHPTCILIVSRLHRIDRWHVLAFVCPKGYHQLYPFTKVFYHKKFLPCGILLDTLPHYFWNLAQKDFAGAFIKILEVALLSLWCHSSFQNSYLNVNCLRVD